MVKYIKRTFRSLSSRNYRFFYIGQSVSLLGTWMQHIAACWFVYRMTHSPFLLGAVGFASQIPAFLLGPFAGVFADRHAKRRILVVTQIVAMVQALVMTVLGYLGLLETWHVIFLCVILGVSNAFDIPTRHAFTIEMIDDKKDLANAIALNSSMFNGARLVGPAIAGVLVAVYGETICFLLNTLSYSAVLIALFLLRIPAREQAVRRTHLFHDLKEGFQYVLHTPAIVSILLLIAILSFLGVPYQVLMPVFAKDIFSQGAHTFGFLVGMSGAGALCGALYLASRPHSEKLPPLIMYHALAFGCAIMFFALSQVLWLSLVLSFIAGYTMMVGMAASNTFLQTVVDHRKRGRVMSFYSMAFMGMVPIGSLLSGWVAHQWGAPVTVLGGGVCSCLAVICLWKKIMAFHQKNAKKAENILDL